MTRINGLDPIADVILDIALDLKGDGYNVYPALIEQYVKDSEAKADRLQRLIRLAEEHPECTLLIAMEQTDGGQE
jgi:hypothetical protein